MRTAILAIFLTGCTAQAAPPFVSSGGSSSGGGGGSTITTDSTFAQCEALTPTKGDQCFPTDDGCPYTMLARADGVWSYRVPGVSFDVTPPPSTGWTAFGSGSVASVCGARVLSVPAEASGAGLRGEYRTDPAFASWGAEFVMLTEIHGQGANNSKIGAGMTDGTGAAEINFGSTFERISRWSSSSAFVGNDFTSTLNTPTRVLGIRLRDDNTNRHFDHMGPDGSFSEVGAGYGRTVGFTGTAVGWWGIGISTSRAYKVMLVHYDGYEI